MRGTRTSSAVKTKWEGGGGEGANAAMPRKSKTRDKSGSGRGSGGSRSRCRYNTNDDNSINTLNNERDKTRQGQAQRPSDGRHSRGAYLRLESSQGDLLARPLSLHLGKPVRRLHLLDKYDGFGYD